MSALLEALQSVTQDDLDSTVKEIDEIEKRLGQLKELRRIIEVKLGVRQPLGSHLKGPRKPRSKPAAAAESNEPIEPSLGHMTAIERHRLRVKEYIMANGPAKRSIIINACSIPNGSSTAVFNHSMFCETGRGIELTRNFE